MGIIEQVRQLEDFVSMGGVGEDGVIDAENQLGVRFASDYRMLLRSIGAFCANGHEITGICSSPRLDVVAATLDERACNPAIPDGLYLIERVDGITYWQDESGVIFHALPEKAPLPLDCTLAEYLLQ